MQSGFYLLSLIAILTSVISASYYLKLIANIHFDKDEGAGYGDSRNKFNITENFVEIDGGIVNTPVITHIHSYIIAVLTLIILLFILQPSILLNTIELVCFFIFYD